jgi:hypothetical protein
VPVSLPVTEFHKSFLGLFFKKEPLPSFQLTRPAPPATRRNS